ncbi:hypothetical protein GCM10007860_25720 [Chitiniphilus shinanonensis]|uniref:Uncharacterized protein n=1 Tax=Chitiniphilus shinanonensis TaxID=553088 RepID=A0ABQ6BVA5_9NEIS|nr:hypothetical protein GCM10007860_25720 [Chitiniphilus shinanonensis]
MQDGWLEPMNKGAQIKTAALGILYADIQQRTHRLVYLAFVTTSVASKEII